MIHWEMRHRHDAGGISQTLNIPDFVVSSWMYMRIQFLSGQVFFSLFRQPRERRLILIGGIVNDIGRKG